MFVQLVNAAFTLILRTILKYYTFSIKEIFYCCKVKFYVFITDIDSGAKLYL